MGGLDVRRKPVQDSPTPGPNAIAAIALDRLYGYTGKTLYRERAEQTLETFAGIAPQYGLFGATYGLATLLHERHALQVVITGKGRSEEHTSELQSRSDLVCRLLLEKKK